MKPIPESLSRILKDFCHMEWYEVDELSAFVNNLALSEDQRLLVSEFKQQLSEAIETEFITPEQFHELTANECESNQEVAAKLKAIKAEVFQ